MATQSWLTNAATAQRFQLLSVGQKFVVFIILSVQCVMHLSSTMKRVWREEKALRVAIKDKRMCVCVCVRLSGNVSKRRLCKAIKETATYVYGESMQSLDIQSKSNPKAIKSI